MAHPIEGMPCHVPDFQYQGFSPCPVSVHERVVGDTSKRHEFVGSGSRILGGNVTDIAGFERPGLGGLGKSSDSHGRYSDSL